MNDFDKAGRYLIKRAPDGFFRWLLDRPQVAFHAWIDARRLALPDQGDLTHDLVAAFRVGPDFEALCLELQATSAAGSAGRLLYGYVPRLCTEEGGLELSAVGGAVVNLTGPPQPDKVQQLPSLTPACRLEGQVLQRTLREERADVLLADVTTGRASRWLLGWLPLLHGGAEMGIIEGWKREAALLPEERDRSILGGLTETFAELAGNLNVWRGALEDWNVIKSAYLEELREQVRAEGARALVLRLGRKKFGKAPTKQQQQQLAAITDLARLEALAERLLDVTSWADLLAAP
ncbi:MAG: DUF4351 domain-containing protein [Gemmataceae bacterium]|nr:DUF4351 domain-containing protein [Gemmataceae bacterium]